MYCLCYLIKNNKYIFKRQLGVQIKPAPGFKVKLLALGKETALGESPHLGLYRVSAENPSVSTALGQLQGLCRSISLSFQTLISLQEPEIGSSAAAWQPLAVVSLHPARMTRSCSAASSAWGSAASTRI